MTDIQNVFADIAVKHGEAIEQGEYKIANKLHTKLMKLYQTIIGKESWDDLKNMTAHTDDNVKLWAATFLLKHDNTTAINVLTELTKSQKIVGLTASTTIDMWNKGMLQL
jgi:dihydrodipicolinate synthase/N-acetylneuraminate lyase